MGADIIYHDIPFPKLVVMLTILAVSDGGRKKYLAVLVKKYTEQ